MIPKGNCQKGTIVKVKTYESEWYPVFNYMDLSEPDDFSVTKIVDIPKEKIEWIDSVMNEFQKVQEYLKKL